MNTHDWRGVKIQELALTQAEALQVAQSMTATTIEEARRALYSAGYIGNLDQIEAVITARELLRPSEWAPGDKLLVVAEGAVFLGVMKEPRPEGKSLVRLVHGDEWLEVAHTQLFPIADAERACARGFGVQP